MHLGKLEVDFLSVNWAMNIQRRGTHKGSALTRRDLNGHGFEIWLFFSCLKCARIAYRNCNCK